MNITFIYYLILPLFYLSCTIENQRVEYSENKKGVFKKEINSTYTQDKNIVEWTYIKMIGDSITTDSIIVQHKIVGDTIFRKGIFENREIDMQTLIKNGDDTYNLDYRGILEKKYIKNIILSYYFPKMENENHKKERQNFYSMTGLKIWNTVHDIQTLDKEIIYTHWTAYVELKPYHEYYHSFNEKGKVVMQTIYTDSTNTNIENNLFYLKSHLDRIKSFGLKPFEK